MITAFPFTELNDDGTHHQSHSGMTLRDWIAGTALQGIVAAEGVGTTPHIHDMARCAYEIADTMLIARAK